MPAAALKAREFFRRGGLLAGWRPDFEFRPGQLAMAQEVEASLADGRHLIVEAGTGTGKTLAYLAPIVAAGKRVVVSTATKALQEQLFFKDIPFLAESLGRDLRACYMKGRANYLCLEKLYEVEKKPILSGLEEIEEFAQIKAWAPETEMGDRAEIAGLRPNSPTWAKIDARREMCSGSKCPQFEQCFITRMHQRAAESDIIVVNHHLFFADLSLRDEDFGRIIPDYQAVVFDEAHEIESVAGQHFGIQISNYRFEELSRDVRRVAQANDFGSRGLDHAVEHLSIRAQRFFEIFERVQGRIAFRNRPAFVQKYGDEYIAIVGALERLMSELKLVKGETDEVIPLERRTTELDAAMRLIFESEDESFVYWMEKRGRGVFIQATPIDVAELLADRLFGNLPSVILTSATLAVDGKFDYIRGRLGMPEDAREQITPGHFDYEKQALLYVPPGLPDPRSMQFTSAAADEVTRILRRSEGRAFVLFTSYQQMRAVHDKVSLEIEYPCLLQGTAPNTVLLDQFRETPHCVLFATASFWQGVDVPGDQLSCVIIDKLPFASPGDPVVEARIRSIRQAGGNPFAEYQVPSAVLTLKQGFGRLIRHAKDRGVLALLDNRITKQRYGKVFLDSLPSYPFTDRIDDVEEFFARG